MYINLVYSYFAALSVITFVFYGYDKRQARRSRRRVPERTLHALALLGGTPGALAGQLCFRHKTKKLTFQMTFWAIVLLQVAIAFCYWYFSARQH